MGPKKDNYIHELPYTATVLTAYFVVSRPCQLFVTLLTFELTVNNFPFVEVIQALVNLVNEPEPEHPLRAALAGEDFS